jgi:hypothetical protein
MVKRIIKNHNIFFSYSEKKFTTTKKKKALFVTSKCPDIHMLQILHFQIPSLHNLGNLNPVVEVCIALKHHEANNHAT